MKLNKDAVATDIRVQKSPRSYAVLGLLLLALALRMVYAYDLEKKITDENERLKFVQSFSVQSEHLNLPMGIAVSHHPGLSVYITAFSHRLTNGSVYGIRIIHILLSVCGLWGLFCLSRELFGYRVAVLALFLGAMDHHLISYAPEFLEPVYLCLVPWLILAVYRAVMLGKANAWIAIGIMIGLGYMCSEIFILSILPIAITLLLFQKTRAMLKTPQFYAAGLLCFLIILPSLIWNYNHQFLNIVRHTERVRPIGLSPRLALLYLGDLLINFKNSSDLVLGLSNTIYGPWSIPCHWVSGLLYLFSLGYSLRFFRHGRQAILLIFIVGIAVPVTLLNAKEPWNEIEWGAMTIFPVICLTAWTADRLIVRRHGRVIYAVFFAIISALTVNFLYGPKCGYASPFWEKEFVGEIIYYSWIKGDKKTASEKVETVIAKHPDCAVAHYFQGEFASDPLKAKASFQKALAIEPFNPLIHEYIARQMIDSGNSLEAFKLLTKQISMGNDYYLIRFDLGEAAFMLGDYATAEKHLKRALRFKPDAFDVYYNLFFVITLQEGRFEEGLNFFERYAMSKSNPDKEYQAVAEQFATNGDREKAWVIYKRAIEKNPGLPPVPSWGIANP